MQFAKSIEKLRASEIRQLMKLANDPSIISFSGGMPNNDLFPVEVMENITKNLSQSAKKTAFQYGPTDGFSPLIESLSNYLESRGAVLEGNRILITTGAQQAINLITKVLVDPNDRILVEAPSFIGAIAAFNSYEACVDGVTIDDEGIDVVALKNAMNTGARPKFLYVIPYFQNPAGAIISPKRKKQLIEFINEYDLPVLEDDPYGELWFDEEVKDWVKPMKAVLKDNEKIMYVGSFAKILGPGFRLGYMLAPNELVEKCELAKQSQDACSSTYTQVLADAYLRSGRLNPYLEWLRPHYKKRAQIMLEALEKYMPKDAGISWTTPHGGFFVWATLPENMDSSEVFKTAVKNGAAFVIGKAFDPKGIKNNGMRLAFSGAPEEKIDMGIKIIADAVKSVLK
ncbi:MAG: PLP-dependent aminotransferase family protein [Chitinispirillales bacterium]|jgi:DNA-binding transcriptional MocR family regulator|nr:PLP-dependent aminotransferase family protein [Chitinispirillales bacterium]